MRATVMLSLCLGLGNAPALLQAQQLPHPRFEAYKPVPSWAPGADFDVFQTRGDELRLLQASLDSVSRDHRWTGLIIGGVLLGVGGAVLGNSLCNEDNIAEKRCLRPTIGVGLVGATVGVVTGGLIGSAIPKRKKQ